MQPATRNYSDALRTFIQARALIEGSEDRALLTPIGLNISSLYFKMGNLDAAEDESKRSLREFGAAPPEYRIQVDCQLGRIAMRRGARAQGRRYYETALTLARKSHMPALESSVLEYFSYDLLELQDVAGARDMALSALRLRLKNRLSGAEISYWALGRAAALSRDHAGAEHNFALAFEGARSADSSMPLWALYRDRGKLRFSEGKLREAVKDLRMALERAELVAVIPTDDNRIAFESGLAEVYSAFVEAGNRLVFQQGGDAALTRETFEVNERGRDYSLRALLPDANSWRRRLPPRHGELLARLQALERRELSDASPEVADAIRHLHLEIEETELAAGAAGAPGRAPAFSNATRAVGTDAALISVALGEHDSWLWTLTAEGLRLHRLQPRAVIAQASRQFSAAVQARSADAAPRGRHLYQLLFGPAMAEIESKADWLLSLDGNLFSVPMTALVCGERRGAPVYLMERHTLQDVTGAQMLRAQQAPPVAGRFVGLGDPIYNLADPRYAAPGAKPAQGGLRLTRLSGSGRELARSAAAWGPQRSSLLLGAAASKAELRRAMEPRPAVLHVATHVLEGPGRFHAGLIALSLNPQGEVDLLTADEIVKQARAASLVVLSGCSTGRAEAIPGAGLMGLTRAWIGAGADAVLATLWPTPDDDGFFFEPFYASLRRGGVTPAAALQRAQIQMLHSGTFRAKPEYWSAYFVIENYR